MKRLKENGGKTTKKRQEIKLSTVLGLVAVAALVLAIFPTQAWAQDTDLDGLTDQQEIDGFFLPDGTFFPGVISNLDRADRLDPATKDLFVILVPAAPTNLPANPLEYVWLPQDQGGLGIMTHEVVLSNRDITASQKAIRITESLLSDCGNVMGVANLGMTLDEATIFTERIRCFVFGVYSDAGVNPPPDVEDSVISPLIKWTISHEVGHVLSLTPEYNSRFGGNHYRPGSGVFMEQFIKYTIKRNNVTFYISDEYSSASQTAATLQ